MRFKLVLVILAISMAAGCTTPLLMVPSSSPYDGRAFEVLGPTEGESCYANILGIPLSRDASLNTAVKEAKLKVNAEALVDVVVDSWSLYTFFFNKKCTIVRANGIRFTGQPAPYLEPKPAVPPVPPKEEAKAKVPAKPKEKKKSKKELARERRKAERERKKAEREAKKQAALEKKRKAEEEKKRKAEEKHKAAEAKKKALEKRRAEEEAKPVPDQYKVFCKYKQGDNIRVETKTQVIEAEFRKCMYFGIRVKQKDKGVGVIPFEQIWMVKKIVPPPPKAEPAKPAAPKTPAKPEKPAKPAKPAKP